MLNRAAVRAQGFAAVAVEEEGGLAGVAAGSKQRRNRSGRYRRPAFGEVPMFAALQRLGIVLLLLATPAAADERVVRIGVMGDMSGFASQVGGPGAALAARMAVQDHGARAAGMTVEVVDADMQNKPDIAAQIARRWFDVEGVDAIADLPVTPVALAVQGIARDKRRVLLISEAATTELTGRQCSPYTAHWADDTHALAAGTARALVESGAKRWFFLTADFAFGHAMQAAASEVVTALGGEVLGAARHPLATADFSSFLLQAQQARADVVAFANVGADLVNAIKQASEFGLARAGQKLTGLIMFVSDVDALGLPVAQGLYVTSGFYWDRDDETRAFARRFASANGGRMPTKAHAATYAAVRHYLAVEAAGTKDAAAVTAQMKRLPINYFGRPARMRADGRVLYDLDLYQVKAPAEQRYAWDYYRPVRTIPADQAFLALDQGGCPFLAR
jgi:branched-chain amino acid transport system substrate-binding protein